MAKMTDEVQKVFDGYLAQTEWMDAATRNLAKDKVKLFSLYCLLFQNISLYSQPFKPVLLQIMWEEVQSNDAFISTNFCYCYVTI